jgi:hypothetical protein
MKGPKAPAAGTGEAEDRPEETVGIEPCRRRIEEEEGGGTQGDEEQGGRLPSDVRAHSSRVASLCAKDEGCRPHGSPRYMIAVGGAGSSAAPAFESGIRTR